ncbi:MAG TPA: hypothetical protein V6D26_12560 [Stenomitos sp.]
MWKRERLALFRALQPANFRFWILPITAVNGECGLKIDPFQGSRQFCAEESIGLLPHPVLPHPESKI